MKNFRRSSCTATVVIALVAPPLSFAQEPPQTAYRIENGTKKFVTIGLEDSSGNVSRLTFPHERTAKLVQCGKFQYVLINNAEGLSRFHPACGGIYVLRIDANSRNIVLLEEKYDEADQ